MKTRRKKNFTITVVIATFNSQSTLDKCLKSVSDQSYYKNAVDILIADGGSKDKTLNIARKYQARIINISPKKQNAEYNKGVAVRQARGDLLLFIDHDNVLPHKHWLKSMIQPFLDDSVIVGVETLRYFYNPKASFLDRYFALFGAGDPLAFYLKKADRLSFLYDSYNLYGQSDDKGKYYKVKFTPDKIPTLGANGFLIKRKILLKNAKVDERHFFHIDVNVDLIRKGYNTYAFIKDSIIHLTGYKNVLNFLQRRKLFMEQYYIKTHAKRRYSIYQENDKVMLIIFILYAATFIKPFIDSLRGYAKVQDAAWFFHPFLCFMLLVIYGYVIIKSTVKKYAGKLFFK